mgnify:CR=1 FL=1
MTFEKLKLLLWLFKTDFFISSFTFGGGYVVLPMIRKYFIEQKPVSYTHLTLPTKLEV